MEHVKDKYPHLLDKEDQEYIANMKKAEVAKQTAEEAYKFGLGIQKAVEDKDMKKLLSYMGGKLTSPESSYFRNKSFDEVFTEEFRTRILSDETGGHRVGWRGWMLGSGVVWYNFYRDSFSITGIGPTKDTSSEETPAAWKIDNKYLTPNCFVYVWWSGDNYETFFYTYIEKDDALVRQRKEDITYPWRYPSMKDFVTNIGTYLNKEVPLNHTIKTGWGGSGEISLTKQLEGCLSKEPKNKIEGEESDDGFGGEFRYEVIEALPVSLSSTLAPYLDKNFEEIKLVQYFYRLGSMGTRSEFIIYGILNLEDGKKVILPLRNFDNEDLARKTILTLK
jgi:hypothetical protein